MTDDGPGLTPSEERVRALLGQLKDGEPTTSRSLTVSILRTARWQSALRRVLRNTGAFAGGLVTGLDVLLGLRRRPGGK